MQYNPYHAIHRNPMHYGSDTQEPVIFKNLSERQREYIASGLIVAFTISLIIVQEIRLYYREPQPLPAQWR